MKIIRVIDGRRYNTETATKVADISARGYNPGDFQYDDTGIYVTAKGAWFIAGEGNAMSRWSRSLGQSSRGGGSGIEPLTKAEALAELEAAGDCSDVIDQYFADSVQDA